MHTYTYTYTYVRTHTHAHTHICREEPHAIRGALGLHHQDIRRRPGMCIFFPFSLYAIKFPLFFLFPNRNTPQYKYTTKTSEIATRIGRTPLVFELVNYIYMYICIYIYMYMYMCIDMYVDMYIYIYICIYICMCIDIYQS